jgi:hypothetical protein
MQVLAIGITGDGERRRHITVKPFGSATSGAFSERGRNLLCSFERGSNR